MAANKYLSWDSTLKRMKEVFGLVVSTGAPDANKIVALDSTGKLDPSVLPIGVGATTVVLPASENLAAGAYVNMFDSGGGVMKFRNADASSFAKRAMGFVLVAVTSGANATVYSNEINTGVSGLTPGGDYFLSSVTPGAVVLAASVTTTAGQIVQRLGSAVSATELLTDIDESPIELS